MLISFEQYSALCVLPVLGSLVWSGWISVEKRWCHALLCISHNVPTLELKFDSFKVVCLCCQASVNHTWLTPKLPLWSSLMSPGVVFTYEYSLLLELQIWNQVFRGLNVQWLLIKTKFTGDELYPTYSNVWETGPRSVTLTATLSPFLLILAHNLSIPLDSWNVQDFLTDCVYMRISILILSLTLFLIIFGIWQFKWKMKNLVIQIPVFMILTASRFLMVCL